MKKLRLNLLWHSTFSSSDGMHKDIKADFTSADWSEVGCYDKSVRYVIWWTYYDSTERYRAEDDEFTDESGCWEEATQSHVRVYHLTYQVSVGQAHYEVSYSHSHCHNGPYGPKCYQFVHRHEVRDVHKTEEEVNSVFFSGSYFSEREWSQFFDEFTYPKPAHSPAPEYSDDGQMIINCWLGSC